MLCNSKLMNIFVIISHLYSFVKNKQEQIMVTYNILVLVKICISRRRFVKNLSFGTYFTAGRRQEVSF